jgi:hypothetical protein
MFIVCHRSDEEEGSQQISQAQEEQASFAARQQASQASLLAPVCGVCGGRIFMSDEQLHIVRYLSDRMLLQYGVCWDGPFHSVPNIYLDSDGR